MFSPAFSTSAPALSVEPLRFFLHTLDTPGYWRRYPFKCFALFALFAVCHALFIAIGYAISFEGGTILAFWPATGLFAALLATTPYRIWPLLIVAGIAGRLIAETLLPSGVPISGAFGYAINNTIEASLFGLFFRRSFELSYRLGRPLYGMAAMCVAALASTTIGGLVVMAIAALGIAGSTQQLWNYWRMWIVADYLAIIVFTPIITWMVLPQFRERWRSLRLLEFSYFVAAALSVFCLVVFFPPQDDSISSRATRASLDVVVVLPLLWAALRFAYPVVGVSLLLFSLLLILVAKLNIGPLSINPDDLVGGMSELQMHLLIVIQTTILIAFAARERSRAVKDMERDKRFQNIILTLTDKLIAAGTGDLEARTNDVLGDIGQFTNADRVVLVRFNRDRQEFAPMHYWNRPAVPVHEIDLSGKRLDQFSAVIDYVEKNGYIALTDIENNFGDLPQAVALELAPVFNISGSTKSAIYIGLFAGGQLIGCVGCSWVQRGVWWSNDSLSLLYLLGQLLANVLQRKSVERSLESYQDRLRHLAAEVSLSEERARRRAAIDLHDGIGQNLAVARMRIGQIMSAHPESSEQWQVARGLIDQALLGTRHIIADLSPAILYELGFVPAIQSIAENHKVMHKVDCRVTESGTDWVPAEDQKVMLHRNVRELLNNIARHAKATEVDILINWQDDSMRVEVSDNGIGMDLGDDDGAVSHANGFGLFSVRETVLQANGSFEIESAAGLGTKVCMSVPRGNATQA